jgi:Spy/CpxP family protein refolding chaperone
MLRKSLLAAFGAAALSLVALAPSSALAAWGGPSNDPFFDATDLWAKMPLEQQKQLLQITVAQRAALKPLNEQIKAIWSLVTDQLTGASAVDPDQLHMLEEQMFVLRRQRDTMDLETALEIHNVLTPDQLAADARRHEQLRRLSVQRQQILNPTDEPKESFELGDLYDDKLGETRGVALTDAQSQQMTAIMTANTEAFKALVRQRGAVRLQMRDMLMGRAAVREEQFSALLDQAASVKEQIDDRRMSMAIQMRAVMTPDQLAQAAALHQQLVSIRSQEEAVNSAAKAAN